MAGRVVLCGGPDPSLVKSGRWDDIAAKAKDYIRTLGKHGGYILSPGGGTAPGTAVENYQALVEASREIGCPRMS